jgi:hypothetical protein
VGYREGWVKKKLADLHIVTQCVIQCVMESAGGAGSPAPRSRAGRGNRLAAPRADSRHHPCAPAPPAQLSPYLRTRPFYSTRWQLEKSSSILLVSRPLGLVNHLLVADSALIYVTLDIPVKFDKISQRHDLKARLYCERRVTQKEC